MPLDAQIIELFNLDGTDLDFKVKYEDTKFTGKRYVKNSVTGEYLGIVGDKFKTIDHKDYFNGIKEVIQENRLPHELDNAQVKISTARNCAFALLDITLPNVKHTITTAKHQTTINERIIALHGIDGSCSNQVFFGAIDSYCSNGQIGGEYDYIKMKNTSGLTRTILLNEVRNAKNNFDKRAKLMQEWANIPLKIDGKTFMESIIKSENLAKKMYELACQEISKRGKNVFALYSAFTNYASYADERNGFNIRNTGFDTKAETMWRREQEVAKWVSSPQFKQLLVA
jgi:hypothetical protein